MNYTKTIEEAVAIRAVSQRLRSEAIDAQLRACDAVCSFIEFELRMHEVEPARHALVKVHETLARARRHIEEPNHVPLHEIDRLARMWTPLAQRVAVLNARVDAVKR